MKKAITSILGIITIFFSSCSLLQSPELYEEEIRDCVKFHLAKAEYLSSNSLLLLQLAINDQAFDEMEEQILEIYNNSDMNYRDVLVRIANDESSDYKNDARKICKLYDAKQIDLSDYEATYNSATERSWTFTELHSGVEFIFKINTLDETQTTWSCYPIEESLDTYIMLNAL
ncbi:MAG: hypothetical protein J6K28_07460 [Alistipes sp.]|nr:hypothetical protein [Alistipes sp.]